MKCIVSLNNYRIVLAEIDVIPSLFLRLIWHQDSYCSWFCFLCYFIPHFLFVHLFSSRRLPIKLSKFQLSIWYILIAFNNNPNWLLWLHSSLLSCSGQSRLLFTLSNNTTNSNLLTIQHWMRSFPSTYSKLHLLNSSFPFALKQIALHIS